MNILHNMKNIEAEKAEVLAILRQNLEKHIVIVRESREGYMRAAKEALQKRLMDFNEGKMVGLAFKLRVPEDHSKVYQTAIRMLELEQRTIIELDSSQVRCLCMDEWDWTASFYASNKFISPSAMAEAEQRGY